MCAYPDIMKEMIVINLKVVVIVVRIRLKQFIFSHQRRSIQATQFGYEIKGLEP